MNNALKLSWRFLLMPVLLGFVEAVNAQSVDIKDYYVTGLIKDRINASIQQNFIITFDQAVAHIYTIDQVQQLPYTFIKTSTGKKQYTININSGEYVFFLEEKDYLDRLSSIKTPEGIVGVYVVDNFSTKKIPETNQLSGKIWKGSRRSDTGKDVEKEIYYVFDTGKYLSYPKGQNKNLSDSGTPYELIGNVAFYRSRPGYVELGIIGNYGLSCTMKARIGNKILFTILEEE